MTLKNRTESSTIAGECFGVRFAVSCNCAYAETVFAHFPLGSERVQVESEAENISLQFDLKSLGDELFSAKRVGSRTRSIAQPLPAALKSLQKEIHLGVAEFARDHVFIHAGVAVWKDLSFIFPGRSHTGKSTLIWDLVQAGATYYSDEYAVFDRDGYVQPFALPINLRLAQGGRESVMPPLVGSVRRPTDLIVFARYCTGAIWRPKPLESAAAMMNLIKNSIGIRSNPTLVIPVLKQVSLQAKAFKGLRGSTREVLDWIELLSSQYFK